MNQYYTRIFYNISSTFFINIINTIKDINKTQFTKNILHTYKFFKNYILHPYNNYVGPAWVLNYLFEKVYIFQTILN